MNTKIYSFKRDGFEILFGKYAIKILFMVWFLFAISESYSAAGLKYPKTSIELVLPVFLGLSLMVILLFWKFSYKMFFDLEEGAAIFYTFKSKKPIHIKISEIDHVHLGNYVKIYFHNKSLYFKGYEDSRFFRFLEKTEIPLKWNKTGKYIVNHMLEWEKKHGILNPD